MAAVKQRMDADDLMVLAYRFDGDPFCQSARFETFSRQLADRFEGRVPPDVAAAPSGWIGVPNSDITACLVDEDGQPTATSSRRGP